jgi:hypothetical protein
MGQAKQRGSQVERARQAQEAASVKKTYGIEKKPQVAREKVRPVQMNLSGTEGRRVVMSTAKRVMSTHADVIKALAKR